MSENETARRPTASDAGPGRRRTAEFEGSTRDHLLRRLHRAERLLDGPFTVRRSLAIDRALADLEAALGDGR
ncbi:MAG: hypothetical protein M3547_10760 [Acidobacteriota bacterium]|nr:hypothetical protein [Acidobacteriota bacterium]